MEKPLSSNRPGAPSIVGELLRQGEQALSPTSSSSRLDAEVLLSHALGCSRSSLIARLRDECATEIAVAFRGFLERRSAGEPVAYITGEREFWGLSFVVTPAVLIPRPESELIVEEGIKALDGIERPRILDLGTGSGCLSIALVKETRRRGARDLACLAIDCSESALAIARENAARHGVASEIDFRVSDWFSRSDLFSPPYDLIVANPPYIDPSERTPVELSYEPSNALFAAEHGLADVREILSGSSRMLAPGGVLLCEVGAGKRALLHEQILDRYGELSIELLGDDSPADRFTVLRARKK